MLPARMIPDLDSAAKAISVLAGAPDSRVTFQIFDEKKRPSARVLNGVRHGSLSQHAEWLAERNRRGAAVCMMLNEGDLSGRKEKNVAAVRALFVDLDGAPLTPVVESPVPPHLVTETSPGRFHAFWRIEGVAKREFSSLQRSLAIRFDADQSVTDLARVIRLPGFFHQKGDPFQSQIRQVASVPPYQKDALIRALNLDLSQSVESASPPMIAVGCRNDALFSRARMLRNRGHSKETVTKALGTINRQQCEEPLADDEVHDIVCNAFRYQPSRGIYLSPKEAGPLEKLPGNAVKVYLRAKQQFDGTNQGRISLTVQDLCSMMNPKTRRRSILQLIESGLLVEQRKANGGKRGEQRVCALYSLPLAEAGSTPETG